MNLIPQIRGQVLPFAPTPKILSPMSRPLRIELPGAYYHVTSRGDRREPMFEDDSDVAALLGVLKEGMHRFDAEVLHTRRANLSQLMPHLNGMVT